MRNVKNTKAITLRVPKYWFRRLNKMAFTLSLAKNHRITVQMIILEAVRRTFFGTVNESLLIKPGVKSRYNDIKLFQLLTAHSNN